MKDVKSAWLARGIERSGREISELPLSVRRLMNVSAAKSGSVTNSQGSASETRLNSRGASKANAPTLKGKE